MLTVADLMDALRKIDRNALIVIGGEPVDGIECVKGRLKDDLMSTRFTPHEKGREKGVYLTRWGECSDGEQRQLKI